MIGKGMPSKTCGAVKFWLTEVVPVGVPLSSKDGATRGCGVVVATLTPAGEFPTALVAITENLYGMPFVKPEVISHEVAPGATEQVTAGLNGTPNRSRAVTKYPVIAEPFAFGAVKEIVAPPSPGVAVTFDGAAGGPIGVIAVEVRDGLELPTLLVATAVKV